MQRLVEVSGTADRIMFVDPRVPGLGRWFSCTAGASG
jgi:hypothetical protein